MFRERGVAYIWKIMCDGEKWIEGTFSVLLSSSFTITRAERGGVSQRNCRFGKDNSESPSFTQPDRVGKMEWIMMMSHG